MLAEAAVFASGNCRCRMHCGSPQQVGIQVSNSWGLCLSNCQRLCQMITWATVSRARGLDGSGTSSEIMLACPRRVPVGVKRHVLEYR